MTSKYANRTEKNLSPVTFKNLVFDGTAPNPQPQRKSEFYGLPPIAAPNLCRGNPKICRRPGILCSQDRMPACYFPKYRYINVMICSLKQSASGLKSVSLIPVVIPSANAQATAFSK